MDGGEGPYRYVTKTDTKPYSPTIELTSWGSFSNTHLHNETVQERVAEALMQANTVWDEVFRNRVCKQSAEGLVKHKSQMYSLNIFRDG